MLTRHMFITAAAQLHVELEILDFINLDDIAQLTLHPTDLVIVRSRHWQGPASQTILGSKCLIGIVDAVEQGHGFCNQRIEFLHNRMVAEFGEKKGGSASLLLRVRCVRRRDSL